MTAVEWLIEQCPRIKTIVAYNILEQTKAIEKEQIIEAYCDGFKQGSEGNRILSEEYYDQTYTK
jgi:hypothetical protein